MSPAFCHLLVGLVITAAGLALDLGWTFQPVFLVADWLHLDEAYGDLSRHQQAVWLVVSFAFNAAVWAFVAWSVTELTGLLRARRTASRGSRES